MLIELFKYLNVCICLILRGRPRVKLLSSPPMPYRLLAATELAEFLRALAHPRRIQIVEELRGGERDVASLAKTTRLSHSSASQHLMVLRTHRVVAERREGRRVFYRLRSEELADWLVQGMDFLPPMHQQTGEVRKAIKKAKSKWSD